MGNKVITYLLPRWQSPQLFPPVLHNDFSISDTMQSSQCAILTGPVKAMELLEFPKEIPMANRSPVSATAPVSLLILKWTNI